MSDIINELREQIGESEDIYRTALWLKVGRRRINIATASHYEAEDREIKIWFGRNECVDIPMTEELLNLLDNYFHVKEIVIPDTRNVFYD